jgi:hypothetical protein
MSVLADQIVESLNNIGFFTPYTVNPEALETTIQNNLIEFARLVSDLTKQLSRLLNIEEYVNPIECKFSI